MASNDETKIYPGSVDRYRELRALRESLGAQSESDENPTDSPAYFAAVIAEELAGLAYILDGIRYSARKS